MKKLVKRYLTILIIALVMILLKTNSYAFEISKYKFISNELRSANAIPSGICKIYKDGEVLYYKEDTSGRYSEKADEEYANSIRNSIKNMLDSGENLKSKIIKGDTYYNETYKEFCYKRNANSSNTDTLIKVILIGYNDQYQFKSGLTTTKGAYIAKKVGETETFYISYDDTWVESEVDKVYNANSIELDKSNIELKVGETAEVKYTVLPDNAISKSVTVSYTDNIEIDTTTSGTVKIKGLKKGDAYIIVKLKENNDITASCSIKVVSSESEIPVTSETITSNEYLIDAQRKYISRIKPEISISTFKSNINSNVNYKIYDTSGNQVSNTNNVTTGMKLKTEKQEYILIVKGDINGDGKISITDLVRVNLYNVKMRTPNEVEKIASDINGDGKISITDVVQLNLAIVGKRKIQ